MAILRGSYGEGQGLVRLRFAAVVGALSQRRVIKNVSAKLWADYVRFKFRIRRLTSICSWKFVFLRFRIGRLTSRYG